MMSPPGRMSPADSYTSSSALSSYSTRSLSSEEGSESTHNETYEGIAPSILPDFAEIDLNNVSNDICVQNIKKFFKLLDERADLKEQLKGHAEAPMNPIGGMDVMVMFTRFLTSRKLDAVSEKIEALRSDIDFDSNKHNLPLSLIHALVNRPETIAGITREATVFLNDYIKDISQALETSGALMTDLILLRHLTGPTYLLDYYGIVLTEGAPATTPFIHKLNPFKYFGFKLMNPSVISLEEEIRQACVSAGIKELPPTLIKPI